MSDARRTRPKRSSTRTASVSKSRTASTASNSSAGSNSVSYSASRSSTRLGRHAARVGSGARDHRRNVAAKEDEEEAFAFKWYEQTKTSRAEVARSTLVPLVFNLFVFAAVAVMVGVMTEEAPAKMTVVFGPDMDRRAFENVAIVGLFVFNVLNLVPTYLFRHVWGLGCVANSEYWLATPERERDTIVFLTRVSVWIGALFNLYVGAACALTLAANRRADRSVNELDVSLHAVAFGLFFVAICAVAYRIRVRFREHRYASVPSDALCA